MNTLMDTNSENKPNILRKKPSFRQDGSYRIFHITKKNKDESDDEDNLHTNNEQIINTENHIKTRYQKRSLKTSNRNGTERWKRKSTKNKRLLFLSKASCESTSNEVMDSSLSNQLINNSVQSIISGDIASKQFVTNNQQSDKQNDIDELSQSDTLIEAVNEHVAHDDAALDNLLARADKLEITVKQQDFNKIQPMSLSYIHRRRKRCIIGFSTVLVAFIIIIIIIISAVVLTLKHRAHAS
ncbi:unnamed protein product [Rotaria sordida]|uniref:Uncharacterized protein n=1 Tax=Rotaria sordida TaxID=392033 RepID=A0A818K381_9BILA|nr:unnamed protein product [Rotaria sordida]CAF3555067.1 unnamed protein product [Rotaria sordida]